MKTNSIFYYFRKEWKALLIVTVTGLIYNVGLVAGPYFEGRMIGKLFEILTHKAIFRDMLAIAIAYLASILTIQACRFFKRNYVRIFANNTNRRMKETLYHQLLTMTGRQLQEEGIGNILTKALSDVDDCSEGMRKFTTEIFDTGIALCAYVGMLLYYDWKLALLCLFFTPFSYIIAERMKIVVQKTGANYKRVAGKLNEETLDRADNAISYRVYGREENRKENYEEVLSNYERASVLANLPIVALPPLYKIISFFGVFCIVYFGCRNVLHTGWAVWDIATFTTFLSCFMKMADKSSKAAKLFNSVHKAQVSWNRIHRYMVKQKEPDTVHSIPVASLSFRNVSFHYSNTQNLFQNVSFSIHNGEILGVTGHVACGKSTLGKLLLQQYPYNGTIQVNGTDLKDIGKDCRFVSYLGHDPQLLNDTIENNIAFGDDIDVHFFLHMVRLDQEVAQMEEGIHTIIGDGGIRLSGGQAQRVALARTLAHARDILVLDDPFSSLDRNTEKEIFQDLRKYAENRIVILISHRLYLFPQLDQVLYMENGQAICSRHEELIKQSEGYCRLYEVQEDSHEA